MRSVILILLLPIILLGQAVEKTILLLGQAAENTIVLSGKAAGNTIMILGQTVEKTKLQAGLTDEKTTVSSPQLTEQTLMPSDRTNDKTIIPTTHLAEQTLMFPGMTTEKSIAPSAVLTERTKTYSNLDVERTMMLSYKANERTDKWLYIGAVSLTLIHKSIIDARIWEKSERRLPAWAKSDEVYLGGTALTLGLLSYTSYNYGKDATVWQFIKTTAISFLIGSESWDLEFGHLVHGDAFYPFPKWYGNWGFKNKTERVTFDFVRVAAAVALLLWDD